MAQPSVSVVNWNIEWRLPTSRAAEVLRTRIFEHDPDVVCLTEAHVGMLSGGFTIEAEADWGYPIREGRRKVVLWSKAPWANVDVVGHADLPSGRYVRGTTDTPLGPLDLIGVCIPWSGAHVSSGRRNRKPWDDHIAYLAAMSEVVSAEPERLIVFGDYNQKVPRSTAPVRAFDALKDTILGRMELPTAGKIEPVGCALIDHIAHTRDLRSMEVRTLDNRQDIGPRLTDHVGVAARFEIAEI